MEWLFARGWKRKGIHKSAALDICWWGECHSILSHPAEPACLHTYGQPATPRVKYCYMQAIISPPNTTAGIYLRSCHAHVLSVAFRSFWKKVFFFPRRRRSGFSIRAIGNGCLVSVLFLRVGPPSCRRTTLPLVVIPRPNQSIMWSNKQRKLVDSEGACSLVPCISNEGLVSARDLCVAPCRSLHFTLSTHPLDCRNISPCTFITPSSGTKEIREHCNKEPHRSTMFFIQVC